MKLKNREMVRIEKINDNKKQFLDLLLLADEQEDMIDNYLPTGDLFALYDDDLKSVCVVAPINSETCELKNIATYEKYQGKGYGRALINFISNYYKNPTKQCSWVQEKCRGYYRIMKVVDLNSHIG